MKRSARVLLGIDGGAGCCAGVVMLALHQWLANLYAFPVRWVVVIGMMNVAYGSYSGTLAVRAMRGSTPTRRAIEILVLANITWAFVCAALLLTSFRTASAFGVAQLVMEGCFVAALAFAEWRIVRPMARAGS